MESYKGILFFLAVLAYSVWLFRTKWLADEIGRNALHEAPPDEQVRWHIRHIRQDLHALVLINHALLLLLAWAVVFKV